MLNEQAQVGGTGGAFGPQMLGPKAEATPPSGALGAQALFSAASVGTSPAGWRPTPARARPSPLGPGPVTLLLRPVVDVRVRLRCGQRQVMLDHIDTTPDQTFDASE